MEKLVSEFDQLKNENGGHKNYGLPLLKLADRYQINYLQIISILIDYGALDILVTDVPRWTKKQGNFPYSRNEMPWTNGEIYVLTSLVNFGYDDVALLARVHKRTPATIAFWLIKSNFRVDINADLIQEIHEANHDGFMTDWEAMHEEGANKHAQMTDWDHYD